MLLKPLLKDAALKQLLTSGLRGIFRGTGGGGVILEPPVIDALYYEDPDAPGIDVLEYEDPGAPTIGSIKFEFNAEEG